ncbi:hypothetical protein FV226_24600 [Methylobacterium sp. WL12]|uniref:hypothetical protein n=1 Tax=Methylobacterium sp. WL12 TaxID=2603890 RepID=UPI0011C9982C|nr:hypothetical protein [Methylobacterium sp. WL12]TXM65675.1 hypothetical protein FV226_24600 [Methylobacterium sp. WL12]
MPEPKAKPPKPSPEFTSWKLTIQQAAIADPRIESSHLRLFLYILHRTWEKDRYAIVHDELIMAAVRGFAVQSTIYRARVKLSELGWWSYKSGSGTAATVYHPLNANVRAIMVKVKADEARINKAQEVRKRARKEGGETLHSQHKSARAEARKTGRVSMQIATHSSALNAGITPCLTPSDKEATATSQDVALGSRLPEVLTSPLCVDCGCPAVVEQRQGPGARFYSLCQEHRSHGPEIEERPIPSNGNSPTPEQGGIEPDDGYRSASRG